MKKFIVLLIAFVCTTLGVNADDVTYTSYGNGVELITKEKHSFWRGDETVYGLRKGGVVLEKPVTTDIQVQEELNIIVFKYVNGVRVYNLSNGAMVGEFFIDPTVRSWLHTPQVTIKPVVQSGKRCYTIHYSNYSDQSGWVEEDVVTLYKESGKLYKLEKQEVLASVEQ